MSTTANRLAIMLASLILSSCVQGQDYQRPPVEVPDGWSRMTNTTDASIASDHQPEAEWWKAFQNE
jgi:outer membrane protein TolC